MIESLRLENIWGVPAMIELLVDKKILLLERTQQKPYYHNERASFSLDGEIAEIWREKDCPGNTLRNPLPRSRLGINVYYNLGVIKRTAGTISDDAIRHALEAAYNETVDEFYQTLKKTSFSDKKDRELKNKFISMLDKIRTYDFTQFLLYKIE